MECTEYLKYMWTAYLESVCTDYLKYMWTSYLETKCTDHLESMDYICKEHLAPGIYVAEVFGVYMRRVPRIYVYKVLGVYIYLETMCIKYQELISKCASTSGLDDSQSLT